MTYQKIKPLDSLVNSQFEIKTELDSWPPIKESAQPESTIQSYPSPFFNELQLEIARRTQRKPKSESTAEKHHHPPSSGPA